MLTMEKAVKCVKADNLGFARLSRSRSGRGGGLLTNRSQRQIEIYLGRWTQARRWNLKICSMPYFPNLRSLSSSSGLKVASSPDA